MYAVIESGGKQHRVMEGEILQLEKLKAGAGDEVTFDRILMVGEGESVKIGTPYVEGGQVTAEVLKQGRGRKITIVKFKRRKHFQKTQGHPSLLNSYNLNVSLNDMMRKPLHKPDILFVRKLYQIFQINL